ncbi:MAG: parallel beta-helix domain-containing protein [Oligoflexus sp.]
MVSWKYFFGGLVLCLSLSVNAASDYQDQLLTELLLASPGAVIEMPEGRYEIDTQLSLTVDDVTIRGQGQGKTVLSFSGQKEGGEGFMITANRVTLENFTIENTPGDGIKVSYAEDVTIRGVEVLWTGEPSIKNGAYGLYPVRSKNVLIEGCRVSGASDAGIYVGQSENIIVRRNIATLNVAGIEIENSKKADVYDNYVFENTGGILIFDLPDLPAQGSQVRLFGNVVVNNNTPNFAQASNSVGDVPSGTGIMVMAHRQVEVFNNLIADHGTTNILLISYYLTSRPINDEQYDPFVEQIYIHDNTMRNGGFNPQGGASQATVDMIESLKLLIGIPFPDIIWGGFKNPAHVAEDNTLQDEFEICITSNNLATFVNLDVQNDLAGLTWDLSPHDCRYPPLPKVEFKPSKS